MEVIKVVVVVVGVVLIIIIRGGVAMIAECMQRQYLFRTDLTLTESFFLYIVLFRPYFLR